VLLIEEADRTILLSPLELLSLTFEQ